MPNLSPSLKRIPLERIQPAWFAGFTAVFVALTCSLAAAEPREVVPLWPNGAPGFEHRRSEPERAESYWVRNIHNPSITVFLPPKESANGSAVLICPGGGHRELVFNAEGVEPARFLNTLGVAAFALKYRLGREDGSPYSIQEHAPEDARRALRLIRSRAAEWNLDANRVGMLGFSAGGEVVSMTAYSPAPGDPDAADPVERMNGRPDFQILIYPGPLGIPDTLPTNAPPAFLLAANDDRGPARVISSLLQKYREARCPVEVHLFERGGHAFNMGNRSKLASIKGWPAQLADWLSDNNFFKPAVPPDPASSQ